MDRFEPALYSIEENIFIQEHAGEPPQVALRYGTPQCVNPKAVRPVLERIYELTESKKHNGEEWVGLESLKAAIATYVDAIKEWEEDKKKGAPYPPSMYEWDSRGRSRFGGIGSDAGFVKTYFDENGTRKPLGINLTSTEFGKKYIPEFVRRKMEGYQPPTELIVDEKLGHLTCPVCQHVENFDPEDPRKINVARGRMANHMIKSNKDVDDHRAAHAAIFRSGGSQVN